MKYLVRHKTLYEQYRRGGLVFSKQWQEWELSEEQCALLEADCWLELKVVVEKEGSSAELREEELALKTGEECLPEGWSAEKQGGNWWALSSPEGATHKAQGASAYEAYQKVQEKLNA